MLDWLPIEIQGHNILYVGDDPKDDLTDFRTVKVVDSVTNPYARIKGTYIAFASNCKEDMPALWKRKYAKMKIDGPFLH